MKNFFKLVLLFAFVVSLSNLSAQTLKKGEMVGQAGLGYGFAFYEGDATVPPISVGLQYGIEDKISIGGLIGYTSSSYEYPGYSYYGGWDYRPTTWKWTYSYILIGARGEYHFLDVFPKANNIDVYAGATLGYYILSVSEPSGFSGGYSAAGSSALFGVHGGMRYYFTPKFAVYGELGYGVGYINAGVALKL